MPPDVRTDPTPILLGIWAIPGKMEWSIVLLSGKDLCFLQAGSVPTRHIVLLVLPGIW
jgi:hypothetical protein